MRGADPCTGEERGAKRASEMVDEGRDRGIREKKRERRADIDSRGICARSTRLGSLKTYVCCF